MVKRATTGMESADAVKMNSVAPRHTATRLQPHEKKTGGMKNGRVPTVTALSIRHIRLSLEQMNDNSRAEENFHPRSVKLVTVASATRASTSVGETTLKSRATAVKRKAT